MPRNPRRGSAVGPIWTSVCPSVRLLPSFLRPEYESASGRRRQGEGDAGRPTPTRSECKKRFRQKCHYSSEDPNLQSNQQNWKFATQSREATPMFNPHETEEIPLSTWPCKNAAQNIYAVGSFHASIQCRAASRWDGNGRGGKEQERGSRFNGEKV